MRARALTLTQSIFSLHTSSSSSKRMRMANGQKLNTSTLYGKDMDHRIVCCLKRRPSGWVWDESQCGVRQRLESSKTSSLCNNDDDDVLRMNSPTKRKAWRRERSSENGQIQMRNGIVGFSVRCMYVRFGRRKRVSLSNTKRENYNLLFGTRNNCKNISYILKWKLFALLQ